MKKVANWFKAGLLCAIIWLILFIITGAFQLFTSTEFYDGSIVLLIADIIKLLALIIAKLCISVAGVYYLWDRVTEYDKQQEEEKQKFDFEKNKPS